MVMPPAQCKVFLMDSDRFRLARVMPNMSHCQITLFARHVGIIKPNPACGTTNYHIGPHRAKMTPHRTLSDHIDLKQHHIGRTCIGLNAVRRRASD